jgi:hypothetical protein
MATKLDQPEGYLSFLGSSGAVGLLRRASAVLSCLQHPYAPPSIERPVAAPSGCGSETLKERREYGSLKKRTALQFPSLFVAIAMIFCGLVPSIAQETDKPRLVLQIPVDQLRGDLPHRYYPEFGEGGFRYLYERGVVYEAAFHRHANTETS